MSAGDKRTYQFASEFAYYYEQFNLKEVTFEPHYLTNYAAGYKNSGVNFNCVANGNYCAEPAGYSFNPLYQFQLDENNTGSQVLMEVIKQICVLNKYDLKTWFRYMAEYGQECFQEDDIQITPACSNKVLAILQLDQGVIGKCFEKSHIYGNLYESNTNGALFGESELQKHRSIQIYPEMFIDGANYKGDFDAKEIYNLVCRTSPTNCGNSPEIYDKEKYHEKLHPDDWKNHCFLYLVTIIGLQGILAIVYWCYKRAIRKDMTMQMEVQISDAVAQYFAMHQQQNTTNESTNV